MRSRTWFGLFATVLTVACGSDSKMTGPPTELPLGTMEGTIAGAHWSTSGVVALNVAGRLVAAGTGTAGTGSADLTVGLAVTSLTTGTFATGGAGNVSGSLADGAGSVWETAAVGGSGTITITTAEPGHVAGTFTFTVVLTTGSGTPATRTITDGRFNLGYF